MSPTTSTPVFRISVVIAVTFQFSILGSYLMPVRWRRTELYCRDAKSRGGRAVMRGRAAPWFAHPDRADRSLRIIERCFQLGKPAQVSVLPGDAGRGTRLMALNRTTEPGGGPSRDHHRRSARDSGSSNEGPPRCRAGGPSTLDTERPDPTTRPGAGRRRPRAESIRHG